MSQWAEIRHMHVVGKVPKKAIARRLGVDVKTVRRALQRQKPPLRRVSPKRGRRLDPYREQIEGWLRAEPKLTAKRIRKLLVPLAGRIPGRTVREYVAQVRKELYPREAYVHRSPRAGEVMEMDFGESWAMIAGRARKVKFLVVTLPYSNVYFAKAYPVERLECLLDGMHEGFVYLGGVPDRAVLDNTSCVVKKILRGRDREVVDAFTAFRGAYAFGVEFCAPRKSWEKGSVEGGVKYVRNNAFLPMPEADSFEELNAQLLVELEADQEGRLLDDGRPVREAWAQERERLRPLPMHPPERCMPVSRVIDKFGHVREDGVHYSVPIEHAYKSAWVKRYHNRVRIVVGDQVVAEHPRSFQVGDKVIEPLHVLPLLERKSRAVGEATAIRQWKMPEVFGQLRERLRDETRNPDREWVRVLRLLEEHGEQELEAAVAEALERGSPRLATIRVLLRNASHEGRRKIEPVSLQRADLVSLRVQEPQLSAYDGLWRQS